MGGLGFRLGAVCVLFCLALSAVAEAQSNDSRDREARALYEAAAVAFEEGRFENALGHFQRAYELSNRPKLLYNIGTTLDRLRRDAEAVAAFERYLRELPDAANRSEVEARLKILGKNVAAASTASTTTETTATDTATDTSATDTSTTDTSATDTSTTDSPAEATAAPPAASETTVPREEPSAGGGGPGAAPWAVFGGSLAVTVVGAVLLGMAMKDVNTVEGVQDGDSWSDVESAYDRAPVRSGVGLTLMGVGLAGATVGLVWALGSGGDSEASQASLGLELGPASLKLKGAF